MDRHSRQCGNSGSNNPDMDKGFHPFSVQRERGRLGEILRV